MAVKPVFLQRGQQRIKKKQSKILAVAMPTGTKKKEKSNDKEEEYNHNNKLETEIMISETSLTAGIKTCEMRFKIERSI